MTFTATCADCDKAWRGLNSIDRGATHEKETNHVVWYDEDDEDDDQTDREGSVTWEPDGGVLQTAIFKEDRGQN